MSEIVKRLRIGEPCKEAGGRCNVMDAASGCDCVIAADEITRLTARVKELEGALGVAAEQMEWLAENEPDCFGWIGPPWPSTTPAIKVAAEKARAALTQEPQP